MRLIPSFSLALSAAALSACQPTETPAPSPLAPSPLAPSPLATAQVCQVPAELTPAAPYEIPQKDVVADVPTAFNMLAVSWSPENCRSKKDYPDPVHQCAANQFGLTLHGLWPNGAEGRHPRYCAAPGPAIKLETVRENFCMMPSPVLQQHEWAAHGTCGWDSPEAYFETSAKLWNALKHPDLEAIPAADFTAGAIRDAFAAANPGTPRNSVYVSANDGHFREVRLCYSTTYQPMACPLGLGLADEVVLKLTPRGPQTPG